MNTYADLRAFSLQPFTPDADAFYTIDTIAHLADVPRHLVLLACRHGLIEPLIEPEYGAYRFDARAIQVLRRIHYLHHACDINFTGIRIIMGLMNEVERLQSAPRDG